MKKYYFLVKIKLFINIKVPTLKIYQSKFEQHDNYNCIYKFLFVLLLDCIYKFLFVLLLAYC